MAMRSIKRQIKKAHEVLVSERSKGIFYKSFELLFLLMLFFQTHGRELVSSNMKTSGWRSSISNTVTFDKEV